jgi:hypothetical protein
MEPAVDLMRLDLLHHAVIASAATGGLPSSALAGARREVSTPSLERHPNQWNREGIPESALI